MKAVFAQDACKIMIAVSLYHIVMNMMHRRGKLNSQLNQDVLSDLQATGGNVIKHAVLILLKQSTEVQNHKSKHKFGF